MSATRGREISGCTFARQLPFSVYTLLFPVREWHHPQWASLPTPVNCSENSPTGMLRGPSPMILDPLKLMSQDERNQVGKLECELPVIWWFCLLFVKSCHIQSHMVHSSVPEANIDYTQYA